MPNLFDDRANRSRTSDSFRTSQTTNNISRREPYFSERLFANCERPSPDTSAMTSRLHPCSARDRTTAFPMPAMCQAQNAGASQETWLPDAAPTIRATPGNEYDMVWEGPAFSSLFDKYFLYSNVLLLFIRARCRASVSAL